MPSFDVVSKIDFQEVDNALQQTMKEVGTRYDFKGSKAKVERKDEALHLSAEDEYKLGQMLDLLNQRLVKRGVELKALDVGKVENATGNSVRQQIKVKVGVNVEVGKQVNKFIKDSGLKVQSAIQGDQLRVTGKNRDDLQSAIAALRGQDFNLPLQYVNFRD